MKSRILMVLGCFVFVLNGFSYEVRTWEDVNGKQVTGRFSREIFGKLTIESEDGEKTILDIAKLSEVDKKYIRVMVPPIVEVETSIKKSIRPKRKQFFQRDEELVDHVLVTKIKKKSQRPFTSRLNVEVFLIAEELIGDNHILLSHSSDNFLLVKSKDFIHEFRTEPTRTTIFRDLLTDQMRGENYKGYILLITSLQGELVLKDSNLPTWMQKDEVINNLRELAKRGASSPRSRHFDKSGNKVPPPRPHYVTPVTD